MNSTIEKPVTSSPAQKTEPLPPLALANQKIISAWGASREHGIALSKAWMAHRNGFAVVPFNFSPSQAAAAEMAHVIEGQRLRSASQNFRPEVFTSGMLDVDSNRGVLEAALRHVEAKYADVLKRKVSAPAPKKSGGLLNAVERLLGDPVVDEPAWPPPRAPITGGLFGAPEPLNVPLELEQIAKAISSGSKSFEQIVGKLNAVNSQLRESEPKPAPPKRCAVGWRVPAHM